MYWPDQALPETPAQSSRSGPEQPLGTAETTSRLFPFTTYLPLPGRYFLGKSVFALYIFLETEPVSIPEVGRKSRVKLLGMQNRGGEGAGFEAPFRPSTGWSVCVGRRGSCWELVEAGTWTERIREQQPKKQYLEETGICLSRAAVAMYGPFPFWESPRIENEDEERETPKLGSKLCDVFYMFTLTD